MKFIKFITAAAIASAFAAPASADTMGVADLAIRSLFVINTATLQPVTTAQIRIDDEDRTGAANSNFNGVVGTGVGPGSLTAAGNGAAVDVGYRCAGPDCSTLAAVYGTVENNTTTHLTAPAGNFSMSDMYIAGSALFDPLNPSPTGASGLTRANSSVLSSTNTGGANSTILNSVSATTRFVAPTTITAFFAINYDAFVSAFVGAGVPDYISAKGSGAISWNLTLQADGAEIMRWAPSELNVGYSSNDFSKNKTYASIGTIASQFVTLQAGTEYSLTINQASNSLAREVPEPGTMVLAALGLFAAGVASRRRSK